MMTDCWLPFLAVPARDEEQRLPHLLRALAAQTWLKRSGRSLPVVVVLNNCRDRSRRVVAEFALGHPQLDLDVIEVEFSPARAHVGSARRLAMGRAMSLARGAKAVLLSTDADATPAPTWLEANLRGIAEGADLVGGRLYGDAGEEAMLGDRFLRRSALNRRFQYLSDRLATLIDPVPHDPWPRHADHTGASLAVRASVYAALGGIPALRSSEDVAFVERALAAGYRLRHPRDVQVTVSARLVGRASGGMADCIGSWLSAEEAGLPHLVEPAAAILRRLHRSRSVRLVVEKAARSGRRQADRLSHLASPTLPRVEELAAEAPGPRPVPAEEAIAGLSAAISALEVTACVV